MRYKIYFMNIKTGQTKVVIEDAEYNLFSPSIAPDKIRIAFVKQDRKTYKYEIWIFNTNTGKSEYLTDGENPAWSPAK